MTTKQKLHLTGLGAGVGGYTAFLALILSGFTAAPLALLAITAGLALTIATADR